MTARRMVTSRDKARTPSGRSAAKVNAYRRCFEGEHGQIVLADLANLCGMFRPVGYREFMSNKALPADFSMQAATAAARAQIVRHVLNMLEMTDDQLISLERAAREEARS
jgi:hypothetical protein